MKLRPPRTSPLRVRLTTLLFALSIAAGLAPKAWAQPEKPTATPAPVSAPAPAQMVQLEFTIDKPTIPADSFARKPIKLWRAGDKYLAVLESPDYGNGIHGMTITHQPDNWLVNLFTKTAKHIVDQSESQVVHAAIFSFVQSEEVQKLEFGNEIAYFSSRGVLPLDAGKVREVDADRYELEVDGSPLRLIVDRKKQVPLRLELNEPDGLTAIEYRSYDKAAKFDPAVFRIPAHIATEEAEPPASPEGASKNAWVGDFLTHYYEHPEPGKIVESLRALSDDFDLRNATPFSSFYAEVMRKSPAQVQGWTEAAKPLSSDFRLFMYLTLRQCGSDACLSTLKSNPYGFEQEGMREFTAVKPPTAESIPLDSPPSLDFLWGHFMASGSETAARRISKLVAEKWPLVEAKSIDNQEMLVVGAARWSLISNAKQHQAVRTVLEEESRRSPVLQKVLAEVDSRDPDEAQPQTDPTIPVP